MFHRLARRLEILEQIGAFLICASTCTVLAEGDPTVGLNALPEVNFATLSSPDRTALGRQALTLHPNDWKHGETDHFIYHFIHSYVATPVSIEAEFCFRVITGELGEEITAASADKAHIYIFEKPDDWNQFQLAGQLEPWTGGIHCAGSLFIQRNPEYKFSDNSLGHEVAHLVLDRFYSGTIPLWLNEGFAEYISRIAHASYQRARNYNARAHSPSLPRDQMIPISQLTTMSAYPEGQSISGFYRESERLIRFLISTDRNAFPGLLKALARGDSFTTALSANYGSHFSGDAALEEAFFAYLPAASGRHLPGTNLRK